MHQTETRIQHDLIYRLAFACLSIACLYALTTTAFAATESTDANSAHFDSVYSWGVWESGLEPAAGQQASVNRALDTRTSNPQFRPNDNAAYMTQSIPVPPVITISQSPPVPVRPPLPVPVQPPAPVAPAIPVIRPDGSGPIIPGAIPTAPNRRR